MDFGKFFGDVVGGAASFFLGAPAEAQPVVPRPTASMPSVPAYAQCAVDVVSSFVSPSDPRSANISYVATSDGQHWLDVRPAKMDMNGLTLSLEWNTKTAGWVISASRIDDVAGKPATRLGFYEKGQVTGIFGAQVDKLRNMEAKQTTFGDDYDVLKVVTAKPDFVPRIYNAIKRTCDLIG